VGRAGRGWVVGPPETFGINGYADCLARFIDVLELGPAHIIGLSFGGALGIALQRHHRSLTTSLVLASAYAGWRGSLDSQVAEQRLTQAYQLSVRSPAEVVDALVPTMFALRVAEADVDAFRAAVEAVHPAGFRAMASASAEDLRDVLPTIDAPTLLIYGDNDERAPVPVAQQMHAEIAGSRLVMLSGAGHVCNVELPARFNDEVRRFLAEVG
jgi:pimeloyl-ACP methyl ester carboxylesterase